MKVIKILFVLLLAVTGSLYAQIKGTDKSQDKVKGMDFSAPRMDISGFDDLLRQIEPNASTGTIYNDQMLEGAVDPNKYTVGPNDIFALGIWGIINQPLPIGVSPEGSLIIPSVGEVNVNGISLADAKQRVINKVKQRYISANVTLTLVSPRRFTITVTGVGQGNYPTSAILRASAVIAFVMGDSASLIKSGTQPSERGGFSLRNITLKRKNGQTQRIDLYKYFATQDERYNPFLMEGDVINIPKYDWEAKYIAVYGAVQYPGNFEYIEGDDLETALQLTRGGTSMANLDSILISRLDESGNKMNNFYVKYGDSKNMK
ncbi:MAG: polysaccharide biosynthesis/export family protein, partial [Saprospiraceae bacterium]